MDTVAFEDRGWEAWQQMQVVDALGPGTIHGGELLLHLGDPVAVPDRKRSIHRWRDQEETFLTRGGGPLQDGLELLEDGLNPVRDRRHRLLGIGDAVRHAGQQYHVRN